MQDGGFVPWEDFRPRLITCCCPACTVKGAAGGGDEFKDIKEAIQASLDAYRGKDPAGLFRKSGQEAMDQRSDLRVGQGSEGETA